jgi:hypothetical protein
MAGANWQLVGISREFLASGAYVPFIDSFKQTTEHTASHEYRSENDQSALTDEVTRDLEIQLGSAGFAVYTM